MVFGIDADCVGDGDRREGGEVRFYADADGCDCNGVLFENLEMGLALDLVSGEHWMGI